MALNLRILNNTLSASHFPLTELKPTARLTADSAATSSTLTVNNITGFAVGQYALLGNFGDPTAEIVRLHTVTAPSGTTITLNAATVSDHFVDTPVTVLDWNQVEFSRAATLAGAKSVLATTNLYANAFATSYIDLTNTTGYGFFRFKNSASGAFSAYSTGVPYTGNPANSVEQMALAAVTDTLSKLNDDYCQEADLIADADECQRTISAMRDWAYEIATDETIPTVQGETVYSLSSLTLPVKHPESKQSFLSVRVGNRTLDYVDLQQLEDIQQWANESQLAADATVGATSITLVNSSSFNDEGTVLLRTNGYVSYTDNNKTTNVLSGISASDITVLVASGATVWQNINVGTPERYTVFDSSIILDIPPDETNAGINFKLRYLQALPALTSFASTTSVPFYQVFKDFIASKIMLRKKNFSAAREYQELFKQGVADSAATYKLQSGVTQKYFNLQSTSKVVLDDPTVIN